jgi:AcrR family transcriptional regulator
MAATLTAKGAATRARIVEHAADLVLARGIGQTSLDDIRAQTATSKSQLFHYFPGGKSELGGAIAAFQAQRLLDDQRPALDHLDSWASWAQWRDALLAHYGAQAHFGCPIGALTAEVAVTDAALAAEVAGHMTRWRDHLERGVQRMIDNGTLRADTDAHAAATAVFAALQGGLLLTRSEQRLQPLEDALDGALRGLRSYEA